MSGCPPVCLSGNSFHPRLFPVLGGRYLCCRQANQGTSLVGLRLRSGELRSGEAGAGRSGQLQSNVGRFHFLSLSFSSLCFLHFLSLSSEHGDDNIPATELRHPVLPRVSGSHRLSTATQRHHLVSTACPKLPKQPHRSRCARNIGGSAMLTGTVFVVVRQPPGGEWITLCRL